MFDNDIKNILRFCANSCIIVIKLIILFDCGLNAVRAVSQSLLKKYLYVTVIIYRYTKTPHSDCKF